MSKCGAIKKSDNKLCTNAGLQKHGGRCGIHKNAKATSDVKTAPVTPSIDEVLQDEVLQDDGEL